MRDKEEAYRDQKLYINTIIKSKNYTCEFKTFKAEKNVRKV